MTPPVRRTSDLTALHKKIIPALSLQIQQSDPNWNVGSEGLWLKKINYQHEPGGNDSKVHV